jgi:hypothetical protein
VDQLAPGTTGHRVALAVSGATFHLAYGPCLHGGKPATLCYARGGEAPGFSKLLASTQVGPVVSMALRPGEAWPVISSVEQGGKVYSITRAGGGWAHKVVGAALPGSGTSWIVSRFDSQGLHHSAWIGPASAGNQALQHAMWWSGHPLTSFEVPDSFIIQNPAYYRVALDAVGVAHVMRHACAQTVRGAPPPPCSLNYSYATSSNYGILAEYPDVLLPAGFAPGELLALAVDRDRQPHLLISAACSEVCQRHGPYLFYVHHSTSSKKVGWVVSNITARVNAFRPAAAKALKGGPSLAVDDAELVADERGEVHAAILGHFTDGASFTWRVLLAGTKASGQDAWKLVQVDSDARTDVALAVSGGTRHLAYFGGSTLKLARVGF